MAACVASPSAASSKPLVGLGAVSPIDIHSALRRLPAHAGGAEPDLGHEHRPSAAPASRPADGLGFCLACSLSRKNITL